MIKRNSLLLLLGLMTMNSLALAGEKPLPSSKLDIAYGTHPRQRLDMYWPTDSTAGCPVAIFIHGGSLVSGDKADADYCSVWEPFVHAGIAFASINYRFLSDSAWPAQAEDCAAAVKWIRHAAAEQGADTSRIFLIGHSSGAMLAALLGTDGQFLKAQGMKPTDLAGIVPMGSIMWDEEFELATAKIPADSLAILFEQSSDRSFGTPDAYKNHWPMKHVNAAMPAFLFLIAEAEQEHPPVLRHAQLFCDSARALGVEANWHVLKDRTHMTAIRRINEPGDSAFAIIRKFVTDPLLSVKHN